MNGPSQAVRSAVPGARRLNHAKRSIDDLPDGAIIMINDHPHLINAALAYGVTPAGYTSAMPRPIGRALCLTPSPNLAVLRAGYAPQLHHSFGT